jgi:hypothetical protein
MNTRYTPRVARRSAGASGAARKVTGPTVVAGEVRAQDVGQFVAWHRRVETEGFRDFGGLQHVDAFAATGEVVDEGFSEQDVPNERVDPWFRAPGEGVEVGELGGEEVLDGTEDLSGSLFASSLGVGAEPLFLGQRGCDALQIWAVRRSVDQAPEVRCPCRSTGSRWRRARGRSGAGRPASGSSRRPGQGRRWRGEAQCQLHATSSVSALNCDVLAVCWSWWAPSPSVRQKRVCDGKDEVASGGVERHGS